MKYGALAYQERSIQTPITIYCFFVCLLLVVTLPIPILPFAIFHFLCGRRRFDFFMGLTETCSLVKLMVNITNLIITLFILAAICVTVVLFIFVVTFGLALLIIPLYVLPLSILILVIGRFQFCARVVFPDELPTYWHDQKGNLSIIYVPMVGSPMDYRYGCPNWLEFKRNGYVHFFIDGKLRKKKYYKNWFMTSGTGFYSAGFERDEQIYDENGALVHNDYKRYNSTQTETPTHIYRHTTVTTN